MSNVFVYLYGHLDVARSMRSKWCYDEVSCRWNVITRTYGSQVYRNNFHIHHRKITVKSCAESMVVGNIPWQYHTRSCMCVPFKVCISGLALGKTWEIHMIGKKSLSFREIYFEIPCYDDVCVHQQEFFLSKWRRVNPTHESRDFIDNNTPSYLFKLMT